MTPERQTHLLSLQHQLQRGTLECEFSMQSVSHTVCYMLISHDACHASCSFPWTHKPYHPPTVMTRMPTQSVIPNVQSTEEPCQKPEMGLTHEVTKPRRVRTCVSPSNSAHFPSCSQGLGKHGCGHHVSASISTAQECVSACNLAPACTWAAHGGRTCNPMTHCCGQARQANSRIRTFRQSSWSGGVGAHPLRD